MHPDEQEPPPEIAVLIGGPEDGRSIHIPGYLPHTYRVPVRSGVIRYCAPESVPTTSLAPLALYQLILAFDMRPSRDDLGRLRYRYRYLETADV